MDVQEIVDRVESVISDCVHRSGTDLPFVDMILISLRCSSYDVGSFLDAILVIRDIEVEDVDVLVTLRQLHVSLNQLRTEYEKKLLALSMDPTGNVAETSRQGRPWKIINLALVQFTLYR